MNTGLGLGQPLSGLSQLRRTGAALETFQQQLSSGLRIPTAAVDAAAAGVVVEVEAIAASERVAVRNANDGLSLVQTAEGATGSITDNLQRMRELAVQASSETLADDQRALLDEEFQALREEIDRTAASARFGDRALADGSSASLEVQVGATAGGESRIDVELADLRAGALGVDASSVATADGARAALGEIDGALEATSRQRADLGSTFRSLESAIEVGTSRSEELTSAASRIQDVDLATLISEQSSALFLQQAGTASRVQAQQIHRVAVTGLLS